MRRAPASLPRGAVIALWLFGLMACGGVIAHTNFSTDMSAFLPSSAQPAQQLLAAQLHEGVAARLILLAIEAAPPDTLAALSTALADRLRRDPTFAIISNGDEAAFARDRDLLWRNRYLLSSAVTPGHFGPAALHAALQADVQWLDSDFGMLAKRSIPADPTGEMLRLIDAFSGQAQPTTHNGVWMSADGRKALLMAQTVAAGFDLDGQARALQHIEAAFAELRGTLPGDNAARARLIETGPPVFAVQTRARMKSDVQRLSLIATMLVATILLFAYRSPRLLVLGLLPVLSGIMGGIAGVSLAFGFVHGVTLGFGVTLIGEAVDYAIYLLSQTAPDTALAATLPRIWSTLRLGMLTSVCGFGAMLFSSFTGFAQLGLFTIAGLVVALSVTRWVLPALLPRGVSTVRSLLFAAPVLVLIRRRTPLRFAMAGLLAAAAVALAAHRGPYWDDDLASMSPLPDAAKSQDEQLRRELGAPDVRYLLVIQADDREDALVMAEHIGTRLEPLVAKGAIAGFDSPALWLPSQVVQRARQAALPDAPTLAANLAQAIEGIPFRPDAFTPFLADIAAARRQKLLQRADLDGTSLALRVDSLLVETDGHWLAMLPLRDVSNPGAVAALVMDIGDKQLVFLDLKAESDRLLATYLRQAQLLSVAGSVAIVALLLVSLRSARRTVTVLLPLAASVICTTALLLGAQGRLSIFNLFGLLLVVAVGSNYCLFFEGAVADDELPYRRMVASLVIADLCTVIGFGILSFSAIPVLHGIGVTVALGACMSLLFGAILSTDHSRSAEARGWAL